MNSDKFLIANCPVWTGLLSHPKAIYSLKSGTQCFGFSHADFEAFDAKLFLVIASNLGMLFLFSSIMRQPWLGPRSVGLCMNCTGCVCTASELWAMAVLDCVVRRDIYAREQSAPSCS